MYRIYEVQENDNLENIANKFSTTPEVLKTINKDLLFVEKGMKIIVPNNTNIPFKTYIVKKGDSLYDIARRNNINYMDIIAINGIKEGDYIYPNQEILIPKEDISIYNLNDTKTLNEVANILGLSTMELIDQNASIYLLPNQIILYKKREK